MKTINISGIVETSTIFDCFDTILLVQDDGYKQDLVGRLNEAAMNYGRKVAIKYFVAPVSTTLTFATLPPTATESLIVNFLFVESTV